MQQLSQAQQRYQTAIKASRLPDAEIHLIVSPTDQSWRAASRQLKVVLDRMLAQGIPPGLPPKVLQQAVQLNLRGLNAEVQAAGLPLLLPLLPSLTSALIQRVRCGRESRLHRLLNLWR